MMDQRALTQYQAIEELRSAPLRGSYILCPEDEPYRIALDRHIFSLQKKRLIDMWHKELILPGNDRQSEIDSKFVKTDLFIILLSRDVIPYLYEREMQLALERHELNQARLIPIMVRPLLLDDLPISKLQVLPARQGKAITELRNRDRAWTEVAAGIRRVTEEMIRKRLND